MIKVWKSVGAVRIYSRPRALLLLAAVLAGLLAAGFAVGRASDRGSERAVRPVAAVTATPSAKPDRAASGAAVRAAYRRGLRAGSRRTTRRGAGAASVFGDRFKAGSAYFVMFEHDDNGALRIGPSIAARLGFSYRLCREGRSVCERPSD
jgi:hypothetical protein